MLLKCFNSLSENELRKKWKSLRDNYRQELQKCRKNEKSGSAAMPIYQSKWLHFNDLNFLQISMTPAKLSGNFEIELVQENITETNVNISTASEVIVVDTLHEENIPCDENVSPPKRKKSKTVKEKSLESDFLEIEKEKLKLIKENTATNNNSNHNFLVSFVPYMDQMSQRQNLKCRASITNLFCQMNDVSLNEQLSTPTPSTSSWSENILSDTDIFN